MKLKYEREKNYAYNINSSSKKGSKNISFKMLTGNFYEDLINSDINLHKMRHVLSTIKNKSIKESIYCNKEIPKSWKTILGYSDVVYKAIDQDPDFAFYIGSSNKEKKTNEFIETKLKSVISTGTQKNKKFLNLDGIDKYIKDNNVKDVYETEKEEKSLEKSNIFEKQAQTMTFIETKADSIKKTDSFLKTSKPTHLTQNGFYWGANDHVLNDKLVSSKLDEYRTKYDMNKFMNDIRSKRIKDGKDKDKLNYVPNFIKENKNNYRELLKTKIKSNKENVLKKSIYSNFLPAKDFNQIKNKFDKNFSLPKLRKPKTEQTKSIFLNVAQDFDTPIEITNPKIKRDLELINYYGPKYTNCHVCHKRNIEFYQNSEPKQTLILLHYLKKVKLNDYDEKKHKKTSE